jgi:hypothetical protein
MVANAYSRKGEGNGIYYVYGPEKALMKKMLEGYCEAFHPEIKTVSILPIPMLKIIAFLTGNKDLKHATSLFSYFEKVKEPEIPEANLALLGRPSMDFKSRIEFKNANP